MRFSERSGSMVRYKSMLGFTQILLLFLAIALMGIGIFDYINPEVLMLGKASIVLIFIGGLILMLGTIAPLAEMLNLSKFGSWIGAFFLVSLLAVFVVVVSILYEGGNIFG